MAIKIGKRAQLMMLLFIIAMSGFFQKSMCTTETLDLHVINNQGISLESVGLQQPFSVIVSTQDTELRSWPHVEGLHVFKTIGQRSDMNVVVSNDQKKQERRFLYSVVADTPGTYTIGPARFQGAETKPVTLTVIDAKQVRKSSYPQPVFECILEKKNAVVGEKIPFILRFSYQDPDLTLTKVEVPRTSGLKISSLDEGKARSHVIKNELWHVIEYRGYIFPERSGGFGISRLRADYTEKRMHQSLDQWAIFALGGFSQTRSVLAQPLSISVEDVPNTTVPTQAVGTFNNFTASVSAPGTPQGEAVVFTLALEGDADFEKITAPPLKVPEHMRFYESKTSSEQKGTNTVKKWEYILQGLKTGSYTIKEQKFTYFDTKTRSVKTLKTKPITLTITQSPLKEDETQSDQTKTKGIDKSAEKPKSAQHSMTELEQSAENSGHAPYRWLRLFARPLPMSLFLLLFLLAPLLALLRMLFPTLQRMLFAAQHHGRSSWALTKASYQIRAVCKKGDLASLHVIMKRACINRFYLDEKDEDMKGALLAKGWNKDLVEQWLAFLQELLSYTPFAPQASYKKAITQEEIKVACTAAHQWIYKLRSIARLKKSTSKDSSDKQSKGAV